MISGQPILRTATSAVTRYTDEELKRDSSPRLVPPLRLRKIKPVELAMLPCTATHPTGQLEKSAHQRVYSRRMGHLENLVSQDGCPLQHNRGKLEFFTETNLIPIQDKFVCQLAVIVIG
ncbi:hypothetical protein WN51_05279 [Melipona quadrifasciata]|uniref:Uncharacterized protein n=1 Tax=Melipona quadrifasciata TaxID=166423 RepID=A0A0M9ADE7_9HYME|nr:hypothetical protein WN51_05279 [Melipona quadrifasciata]